MEGLNLGNAYRRSDQNLLILIWYPTVKIQMYKAIILRVVLCWCEILFLKLREKPRVRVLENRALREVFGSKRK